MLSICADILPQTCLSYMAFRISFLETLERIVLATQVGDDCTGEFGFLTEVPFLKAVPPHVQLDLLAETWSRHVAPKQFNATLVDESIVYATCETAALVVEKDPSLFRESLHGGPLVVQIVPDHFLSAELRGLHLNLSNDGDFLMISQFEDMQPEEARSLKKKFGLDETRLEQMFDVLGRWSMSADFLMNLSGLLTKREIIHTALKLGIK